MTMCVCAFKFCFAERSAVFPIVFGKIERTILEFDMQPCRMPTWKGKCSCESATSSMSPQLWYRVRITFFRIQLKWSGLPSAMASQNVFGFVSVIETLGRAQTCSSMPWWFRNPCCSAGCAASNQSIANVHINYYIMKVWTNIGLEIGNINCTIFVCKQAKKTFPRRRNCCVRIFSNNLKKRIGNSSGAGLTI